MLLHVRQKFFQQKTRIGISENVVFKTAVKSVQRGRGISRANTPRLYKYPHGNGHLSALDKIVKDGGRFPLHTILVDVHTGWLVRPVLSRNIDPVLALR